MSFINKLINVAKAIAVLWPLVNQFVEQAEELLPEGGNGAAKMEMVRQWLQAAYAGFTDLGAKFEDVWPVLQNLISALVSTFNNLGVFKKP